MAYSSPPSPYQVIALHEYVEFIIIDNNHFKESKRYYSVLINEYHANPPLVTLQLGEVNERSFVPSEPR